MQSSRNTRLLALDGSYHADEGAGSTSILPSTRGAHGLLLVGCLVSACMLLSSAHGQPQPSVQNQNEAKQFARQKGWPVRLSGPRGTVELQRIVNGIPLYFITENANAADTVSTDEILPGGSSSLDLAGEGVTLGIWDAGGVKLTHVEFAGRATQLDFAACCDDHATHVGGTMIASGVFPGAKGMAPSAQLSCYDWNSDDFEMSTAAQGGLRVSNHSYGFITGWYFDFFSLDWYWYGDVTYSEVEDYYFGYYDDEAFSWDQIARGNPRYLIVKSAGNDRNEGPASGTGHWFLSPTTGDWTWSTAARSLDGNGGYDSISHGSTAKNILTVGAVEDISGGYAGPGSVMMTSFSCWGPCDDGRIKPDIVANGSFLFSSIASSNTSYAEYSGTSMSSPSTSGSLGLLIQHFRDTHPDEQDMRSATLKAVVIHTADEAGGAPGPDYRFGWGLLNTLSAAETISADVSEPKTISEYVLGNGETFELSVITQASSAELRATIVWIDPPALPTLPILDPMNQMLINDLDVRLLRNDPMQLNLPWVLNPGSPDEPASNAVNTMDNVEQIVISNPGDATYTLTVEHTSVLEGGSQAFSLIITGAAAILQDCNENGVSDAEDITNGTSADCNENGLPDECDISSGLSNDCNTNDIPDDCEFADCNLNCVPDEVDLIDNTSEDCNENAIPDECDVDEPGADCNDNLIPDECDLEDGTSLDCNENGLADECDIEAGISGDCNGNSVPDECDIESGASVDCNLNGIPDDCDIALGFSNDCNGNDIPDDCEFADCNLNCVPDEQDILEGTSLDCNENGAPDECDVTNGYSDDINENGTPDDCENLALPGFEGKLIAREGRDAPGADGAYQSLQITPLINNNKQVAYWAQSSFSQDLIYVYSDGVSELRASTTDPAPGTQDEFFEKIYPLIAFNDGGTVVFSAELSGASIRGLFMSTPDGVEHVALHGDPVPDTGGTLDFGFSENPVQCTLVNDGTIYFIADIAGAMSGFGQSGALFRYEAGLSSVVAASGQDHVGIGLLDSIDQGPWSEPGGVMVFRATTESIVRVIRLRYGNFDEVVAEGDQAIGSSSFEHFDAPISVAGPIDTFFSADFDDTHGVFKHRLTNDIVPLVLVGQSAPIEGTVFVEPRDARANPLGDVYFYSQVSDGVTSGVFRLDQQSDKKTAVLNTNDPAPAAGGLTVDDVSAYALNSIGDMALMYKASDGGRRVILLDQHLVGDFDLDDDVDLLDYNTFLGCFAGPVGEPEPECVAADFDGDGDIDAADFAVMQDVFIECEQNSTDCNGNGVGDACEVLGLVATDCDGNGSLDTCDIAFGGADDCDGNWLPDSCDLDGGDLNGNGIPDLCELLTDCNYNAIDDAFELVMGLAEDCDVDGIPDECELYSGTLHLIASFGDEGTIARLSADSGAAQDLLATADFPVEGVAATCDGQSFALGGGAGEVAIVNEPAEAVEILSSNTLIDWAGAAYDCATNTLYGATANGPIADYSLYRISTTDGSLEFVGNLGAPIDGLAFDSANGVLYGGVTSGLLYTIDTDTAFRTVHCSNLSVSQAAGLAFADGFVYLATTNTAYRLDPTTCTVESLGAFGFGFEGGRGLAARNDTSDCNGNAIPDNCDIASGFSLDQNGNGLPDECNDTDCNMNGVLDPTELTAQIVVDSGPLSPFGEGFPGEFIIPAAPFATSNIELRFDGFGEFAGGNNVDVTIAGVGGTLGFNNIWQNADINCGDTFQFQDESAVDWNDFLVGSEAVVTLNASAGMDPFQCAEDSFIKVTITYLGENDCDNNGILDSCDVLEPELDCNANGVPDLCDIERGSALDCNDNGVPDVCDIASGMSIDSDGNGIADECEDYPPSIFWTDTSTHLIERSELSGAHRTLVTDSVFEGSMDVSSSERRVYWLQDDSLFRTDFFGSTVEALAANISTNPRDLAIDETNERIYMADGVSGTAGKIISTAMDGTDVMDIVTGLDNPILVSVDATNGKVYWVDQDAKVIQRANTDGSNLQQVVIAGAGIGGIALHIEAGYLFWSVSNQGKLFRSSLDGSNVETIATDLAFPYALVVDPVCDRLYSTSTTADHILEWNLDGTGMTPVVTTGLLYPAKLAIYTTDNHASFCDLDCNDNGVPDSVDIEDGTSFDCNQNSLPDECDIADGNSVDFDGDGIPDECQSTLDPDLAFDFVVLEPNALSAGALNNAGQLAYFDENGVHLLAGGDGVMKAHAADFTELATSVLRLNDAGQIVIHGVRADQSDWEILRIEPDQAAADVDDFTVIARATGFPFSSFPFVGSLAEDGTVAFRAESPIHSTTYLGDGTGSLFDPSSYVVPFPGSLFEAASGNSTPLLNNNGRVAQISSLGGTQVIVGIDLPVPNDPDFDDYVFYNDFSQSGLWTWSQLAINDSGRIAFRNNQSPFELVLTDGSSQTVLVTNAELNTSMSMNVHDEVLHSTLADGPRELRITNGSSTVTVLQVGATIEGLEILDFSTDIQSYSDAREVLLLAKYLAKPDDSDFSFALVKATPSE